MKRAFHYLRVQEITNMQRFILLLSIGLSCLGIPPALHAQNMDIEKISGTWILESGELGGKKLPQEFIASVSLIISGTSYSTKVGTLSDKGSLKFHPDSKPKGMDIVGIEGPNQGKTFPAIYEFSGNILMICYDLEGKKKPDAFKSKPGTQTFLAIYKREKK